MSTNQKEQFSYWTNLLTKIALGIASFMAVSIFNDIKDDIKAIKVYQIQLGERVSTLEGELKSTGK